MEGGEIRTSDGVGLRWRGWTPDPTPRGTVVVVHGYGEHGGRYDLVAAFLVGAGFRVVAYDQRGHGRSGGKPGFVSDVEEFLSDLDLVLGTVVGGGSHVGPLILWGQSMGGLVTLRYLQTRRGVVAGAVISSPWLATKVPTPWWKVALARILQRIAPQSRVPMALAPETLMRDAERQRAYLNDPLVHHFVTPGLYWAVVDAQKRVLADPGGVDGVVLVLVPGADPVVDSETTLRFLKRARRPALGWIELEGLLHEPHNEPERAEVFSLVERWLDDNFGGAPDSRGRGGPALGPPASSQKK